MRKSQRVPRLHSAASRSLCAAPARSLHSSQEPALSTPSLSASAIPRRSRATVAPGFVTGMLAGLQRRGLDATPLLARAGIDLAETDTRIPV